MNSPTEFPYGSPEAFHWLCDTMAQAALMDVGADVGLKPSSQDVKRSVARWLRTIRWPMGPAVHAPHGEPNLDKQSCAAAALLEAFLRNEPTDADAAAWGQLVCLDSLLVNPAVVATIWRHTGMVTGELVEEEVLGPYLQISGTVSVQLPFLKNILIWDDVCLPDEFDHERLLKHGWVGLLSSLQRSDLTPPLLGSPDVARKQAAYLLPQTLSNAQLQQLGILIRDGHPLHSTLPAATVTQWPLNPRAWFKRRADELFQSLEVDVRPVCKDYGDAAVWDHLFYEMLADMWHHRTAGELEGDGGPYWAEQRLGGRETFSFDEFGYTNADTERSAPGIQLTDWERSIGAFWGSDGEITTYLLAEQWFEFNANKPECRQDSNVFGLLEHALGRPLVDIPTLQNDKDAMREFYYQVADNDDSVDAQAVLLLWIRLCELGFGDTRCLHWESPDQTSQSDNVPHLPLCSRNWRCRVWLRWLSWAAETPLPDHWVATRPKDLKDWATSRLDGMEQPDQDMLSLDEQWTQALLRCGEESDTQSTIAAGNGSEQMPLNEMEALFCHSVLALGLWLMDAARNVYGVADNSRLLRIVKPRISLTYQKACRAWSVDDTSSLAFHLSSTARVGSRETNIDRVCFFAIVTTQCADPRERSSEPDDLLWPIPGANCDQKIAAQVGRTRALVRAAVQAPMWRQMAETATVAKLAAYARGAAHGFKNALILPPLFMETDLKDIRRFEQSGMPPTWGVICRALENMECASALMEQLHQQAQLFFWIMAPARFKEEKDEKRQETRWPAAPLPLIAGKSMLLGLATLLATTPTQTFADRLGTRADAQRLTRKAVENYTEVARRASSEALSDVDAGDLESLLKQPTTSIPDFECLVDSGGFADNISISGVIRGVVESIVTELSQNALKCALRCPRESSPRPRVELTICHEGTLATIVLRNNALTEDAEKLWKFVEEMEASDHDPSGGIRGLLQIRTLEKEIGEDLGLSLTWPRMPEGYSSSRQEGDGTVVEWRISLRAN